MSLNFPNQSRSYDSTRHCVCFWGHESQYEVTFQIDIGALQAISSTAQPDEASMLGVFDSHRTKIQKAAGAAFSRRKQSFYRLSATDF